MVLPVGLWLCKQRPLTVTQSLFVGPEAQGDGRGRAGGEVEATGLLGRFGWELDGEGGIKDPPARVRPAHLGMGGPSWPSRIEQNRLNPEGHRGDLPSGFAQILSPPSLGLRLLTVDGDSESPCLDSTSKSGHTLKKVRNSIN